MPAVVLRDRHELSKRAGPIDPHSLRVRAKMAPAGQAIPAMSAGDVTFADNQVARRESLHVIAHQIDDADKFVTDRHRDRDRFLRPRVPIVNVDVGAADRRFSVRESEHRRAALPGRALPPAKAPARLCALTIAFIVFCTWQS